MQLRLWNNYLYFAPDPFLFGSSDPLGYSIRIVSGLLFLGEAL